MLIAAEILGIHVKGRLTLSGQELEGMDSLQLGDAIQQVEYTRGHVRHTQAILNCFK